MFERRAISVVPAEIRLSVPKQIPAGQRFEVKWTGPNGDRDYITIVPAGASEGEYKDYKYTREGSPLSLHAPKAPGEYEIRYQSDRESGVFARQIVSVVPVEINLEAPKQIPAGERFEVKWIGPDGDRDYITIVPADAPEGQYKDYQYTKQGSPITLNSPAQPGDYEVRYQSDRESGIFASIPITLTDLEITLQAPPEIVAGEKFEVNWTGPDGKADYITIVPAGAPEGTYTDYFYTSNTSPGTLTAPDELGQYEIRYSTDRGDSKGKIFDSIPIVVK